MRKEQNMKETNSRGHDLEIELGGNQDETLTP